jgi:hypothetical protein
MANSATQAPLITAWRRAGFLLALVISSALAGGCSSTISGEREAYYASRRDTVMYRPGTGLARVSLPPDNPFDANNRALAERYGSVTDVTRWSDMGLMP